MKPKIKLIIFDSAGVVIDGGYPVTCQKISKKYKIPYQVVLDIFQNKYFFEACSKKESSLTSWKKSIDYFKLDISAQELENYHLSLHKVHKPVIKIAKKLSQNYKIILLSNNFKKYIRLLKKKFGLEDIFHTVINSQTIKLNKNNPEMFKYVLKKFKVKGEEVVYIDDIKDFLIVAKKLGIKGIHYQNITQFKRELKDIIGNF